MTSFEATLKEAGTPYMKSFKKEMERREETRRMRLESLKEERRKTVDEYADDVESDDEEDEVRFLFFSLSPSLSSFSPSLHTHTTGGPRCACCGRRGRPGVVGRRRRNGPRGEPGVGQRAGRAEQTRRPCRQETEAQLMKREKIHSNTYYFPVINKRKRSKEKKPTPSLPPPPPSPQQH